MLAFADVVHQKEDDGADWQQLFGVTVGGYVMSMRHGAVVGGSGDLDRCDFVLAL